MRISSVTNVQNNNAAFNRRPHTSAVTEPKRPMNAEEKLLLGVKCLGIIGAAALVRVILKENNVDLGKMAKNSIKNIGKTLSDTPPESGVIKVLNGKRDAEGVKIYNAYMASAKQKSLAQKVLDGNFNHKPQKVFQYLTENSAELQRTASALR